MQDLISRQDAIDSIGKCTDIYVNNLPTMVDKAEAYQALNEVPSAQPQWIPVSERLPKLDEVVLATTEWNDITIAWRTGIDKWYIHEGNTNSTTDDLTAWMHLPEPYKAGRRTDGNT